MQFFSKLWRSGFFFALILMFCWQLSTPAQVNSQLDARVSRLESENTLLRSRISRLETNQSRPSSSSPPVISPSAPDLPTSTLADDPVFKRLATLVIELRERIIVLETHFKTP
jgi:hypothetical protein